MNRNNPVLLKEHKELNNLTCTPFRNGNVDNSEHVLPIILHLRPLIPMNNILNLIIFEPEPPLQNSQLLICRAPRVNPEHLTRPDLLGKHGHGLRCGTSIGLEKRESNQSAATG